MYCDFFGLKTAPFRVTPDTSLFYAGGEREALLNAIVYAISHGDGMVKVVGEVGSGKTMLTRMLEKSLPESITIIYLPNPSLAAKDLVFAIGHELGLELDQNQTKTHALLEIQKKLLEIHANNQRVVVFIDEAQCMPLDTLEELRLLTNLETETDKLLQLVLFGQPELDDHLSHPSVRQIKERIIHNLYLKPFSQAEVAEYLAFRLHKAGYNGSPLFSHSALKALAKYSDGLPRRLSILADKSMLAAYAAQLRTVSVKQVRTAYGDNDPKVSSNRKTWPITLGLAALYFIAILVIASIVLFVMHQKSLGPFKTNPALVQQTPTITTNAVRLNDKEPIFKEKVLVEQKTIERTPINSPSIDSPSIKNSSDVHTVRATPEQAIKALPQQPIPNHFRNSTDDTPLLNQTLSKTKIWLSNPGNQIYTIQVMSTHINDKQKLETFLKRYSGQPHAASLFIHQAIKDDQTFYAVTYGGFNRYASAKEQLETLPNALKRFDPYIKTITSLKGSIQ